MVLKQVIGKHACADLKEVLQIAAGHGANSNFAWDPSGGEGMERNAEGLNGQNATTDLLEGACAAISSTKTLMRLKERGKRLAGRAFEVTHSSGASPSKRTTVHGFSQ